MKKSILPSDGHRAADRAYRYIRGKASHGIWKDFLTTAGESDEWASAFVAVQWIRGGAPLDQLADVRRHLLRRQRSSGGFAYNLEVPEDADSTAWAIRALALISADDRDALAAGLAHLTRYVRPNGITTYADESAIRNYIGLTKDVGMSAWCGLPHLCVTASVALACGAAKLNGTSGTDDTMQSALDAIRRGQNIDGSWEGYWWRTPIYTTSQAIEALVKFGDSSDRSRIEAGLNWIAATQHSDGSWNGGDGEGAAFVTALAVQALTCAKSYQVASKRGVIWLLNRQRDDGAWDPCPTLQISPPWISTPAAVPVWKRGGLGVGVCIADQNRLFTTATCRAALTMVTAVVEQQ